MIQSLTPHFNERRDGTRPSLIIIHGTEVDDVQSRAIFSGQTNHQGSCHYYIDDTGKITQYVDETLRAWHAGIACWDGVTDINSHSIGIELLAISNNRKFTGPETFYTEAQMQALAGLIKDISQRHTIKPWHILGHQDVSCTRELEPVSLEEQKDQPFAQQRKYDPGPHFNWQWLAEQGIGLWHGLQPAANDPVIDQVNEFKTKLATYGYDTSKEFQSVVRAFQTHFLPWHICGEVTEQSVQAIDRLLEKKAI